MADQLATDDVMDGVVMADEVASPEVAPSEPAPSEPAPSEPAGGPGGRARWLRPVPIAVAVVMALLVAATAFALLSWRQEAGLAHARTDALEAAKRYSLDLTSYDYRSMDRNFTVVAQNASPAFAAQYKQVSDQLSGIIAQYRGVSVGTVLEAGVAGGDDSHVDVVLFIDQKITNTQTKDPRTDRSRMKMSLIAQDGTWKIDSLSLV